VKPSVIGSAIDDIESRFVFVYKSQHSPAAHTTPDHTQPLSLLIPVYHFFALQAKK